MDTSSSAEGTKSGRTRKRIFDAAVEVFRRDGFADARLSDIAELAELQTASLYYHFNSKEALAEAVVSEGVQRIFDRVRQNVETVPADATAERLVAAVTGHLEAALEAEDHGAPTVRMFGQIPASVRHRLGAQNQVVTDYWAGLVADAQNAGVIRADLDPQTLSLLVLGSLNWATEWNHREEKSIAEIVRHVTGTLFNSGRDLPLEFGSDRQLTSADDRAAAGRRPRRARGEVSADHVVAAARQCFAEAGVARTRMDDIAQRAGVSRPHLYAFVSSRAELVELAALRRLHELGEMLQRRARDLDGDIAEDIVGQIIETIRLGRDDREFTLLADAMPRSELNELLTSGTSPIHAVSSNIFGPLLARAMAEGRLRSDVAVDALVEWLQGVVALLSGRNDLADEDLRTMARRFVVPGLLT